MTAAFNGILRQCPVSCVSIALLAFAVLAILVTLALRNYGFKKTVFFILYNTLVVSVLLECIVAAALKFPSIAALIPGSFIRHIYNYEYRSTIQYEKDCAVHDEDLIYTLRPGTCVFSNTEYKDTYHINTKGLRDDEKSLDSPEVIVTGDSLAMGWGVKQDETFGHLIEEKAGYKVLNAGVSSYGTAREMLMLNRLDNSNLKYLIIQYSHNDYDENKSFLDKGYLPNIRRKKYEKIISDYEKARRYYPGKYTKRAAAMAVNSIIKHFTAGDKGLCLPEEAGTFLKILLKIPEIDFEGTRIIVVAPGRFTEALRKEIASPGYPDYIRHMRLVNYNAVLDMKIHRYLLDDHLNSEGHEVLADAVLKVMGVTF